MAEYDPNRITYFGVTDTRGKQSPFGIKAKDRTQHIYAIGKTGMGKSTLLENMAIQDIKNGEGMAFIDPHGKSSEHLLDFIPEDRVKDVLYFAPFDMENPISFNIMEDIGPDKRHLVVSGLMSTFKKIWGPDTWSARMEYILQNTLQALLEYPGSTLLGVNKMLSDKEYRKMVVDNIKDPATRSFWVDEFAKYTDRFAAEAVPAIQNKVGQFTSNPLIRNVIGQEKSTFDLRQIMDEGKILIVNLSKGLVGEGNASLLGSMLITKIYLAALSRADASQSSLQKLPNFYTYVDEFQSFANESFADILSEARKYKLNLTMAHQYIEQMSEEVRAAVFGNVGTMVVFRVGPFDAEIFEKEFMPAFVAEDFVNLGQYQMYLKLMIDGVGSQPFSAKGMPPIEKSQVSFKEDAILNSRKVFGRTRSVVEEEISKQMLSEVVLKPKMTKEYDSGAPLKDRKDFKSSSNVGVPNILAEDKSQSKNITPVVEGGLRSALSGALKSDNYQTKGSEPFQQSRRQYNERSSYQQKNVFPPPPKLEGDGRTLKEALGDLLKKEPRLAKSENSQKEGIKEEEEQKSSNFQPIAPNEIPEKELRKILDVDKKD